MIEISTRVQFRRFCIYILSVVPGGYAFLFCVMASDSSEGVTAIIVCLLVSGGPGKVGVVEDVVNFGQDLSQRNSVRVRWPSKATHVYRLGYQGKIDLRCTEEAPGADYYPDHLAYIGKTIQH